MKLDTRIKRKIEKYEVEGGLDQTSTFFLFLAEVHSPEVKNHCQRVALLAEKTAVEHKKDAKAAFFAGLLHDVGKVVLPSELFDGHNINEQEYAKVKGHAERGFLILKEMHLFTALCAGLHHNLYKAGYGIDVKELLASAQLVPETIKKVLEISMIVSVCDFVDAFTHRTTKIKDGSDKEKGHTLKKMLKVKYPNDHEIVETVLSINKRLAL